MTIGWHHPTDESDQWDGFNESGIEHFRSNPLVHLAREIIQNSIDAADSDDKIVVCFRLKEVDTTTIPHLDELKSNFQHCLLAADEESEKAKVFFTNALDKLSRPKIKVFEASDYNTHGMRGPCKNGTSYYAFMKAKGQSKKDGDHASGSYGIGKFAPYSVSDLRTVFVSTIYKDEKGVCRQLSQGKAILMSHDVDGKRKNGIGFWGIKNKCQPVEGSSSLPEWILRSTNEAEYCSLKGSKISILCFNEEKHWKEYLAVSVAENYFAAISENKLSVEIDEAYILDSESINDFFTNVELKQLLNDSKLKGEPEQFGNAYHYYTALQPSPEVIEEFKEHAHLGLCSLRIMVGDDLPKKVCALRNGMFISDSINRLRQFSDYKEFVAILECRSEKGNKLLRLMEPPRHDDFEPNLLPTKEEQVKGRKSLTAIATWIRDMLKKHARDPVSDVTPLDELKDFFGDEGGEGTGTTTEEMNPMGRLFFRAKPVKPTSSKVTTTTDGEGDAGEGDDGTGGGGKDGKGGAGSSGGKGVSTGGAGSGGKEKKPVEITNIRAIVSGSRARKLLFTPTTTGKIAVTVLEAGADNDYMASVENSDVGMVEGGAIILDAVSGERLALNVTLSQDFTGAIKVVANEI